MNKLDKKLTLLYIATLLIAVGGYVCFEFVAPIKEAPLAGIDNYDSIRYGAEVVTDLIAIGFVYLGVRLMVFPKVLKSIADDNRRYARWATIRWSMLALVILSGEAVHYLFLSPSTVGCPIIGALALFFVWPTKGRRESEIHAAMTAYPVECP